MFFLAKYENATTNAADTQYFEAIESEAIENGEALVLKNGKLTKCSETEKPQFISMKKLSAAEEKRRIPCVRTDENQLWRVPVSADPTALKPGDKVTVGDDALTVTATASSSGVITVDDIGEAKKADDEIYVRII